MRFFFFLYLSQCCLESRLWQIQMQIQIPAAVFISAAAGMQMSSVYTERWGSGAAV